MSLIYAYIDVCICICICVYNIHMYYMYTYMLHIHGFSRNTSHNMGDYSGPCGKISGSQNSAWQDSCPKGPSTQHLRTLVPRIIPFVVIGTGGLLYWALGPLWLGRFWTFTAGVPYFRGPTEQHDASKLRRILRNIYNPNHGLFLDPPTTLNFNLMSLTWWYLEFKG